MGPTTGLQMGPAGRTFCPAAEKFFSMTALLILPISAALLLAHTWWFEPLKVSWFYDRVFVQRLLESPMTMSSLQLLDQSGFAWYSDQLDDFSIAHEDRQFAVARQNATIFRRYSRDDQRGQDQTSWLIADFQFKQQAEDEKWRWYGYPVNQLHGFQSQLPDFLINIHAVANESGARDYIARMKGFPRAFDQVLKGLKVREAKGVLPPKFAVEKTLIQIRDFIAPPAAQHPLAKALEGKLDALPAGKLSAQTRQALMAEAVSVIEREVYPSYRRLQTHLEALERQPLHNEGAWRLPDGDAYYQYLIEHYTTTRTSAAVLHQTGLSEVERIGREMDAILAQQAVPGATRAARIQALVRRSDQLYPDTTKGRETILQDYQAIIDEADAATQQVFDLRPKVGVKVRQVPAFSEKTAPGGYYQFPSLDGDRPGIFYANLYKIDGTPKFTMRSLAYHEAIPGHHFQIALQMNMGDLPFFRRAGGFTAYVEGWALYAERLAWEMGLQKQPLDNLGRLQAEMFRAVRLVVDTGMHAKRWTREQAIDYMVQQTGMGENEVTVEIERYLVNPGQALAYKVGMMKILELREYAKTRLGDRFNLKDFHNRVLTNGAVPLDILEVIVRAWVAAVPA